MSKKRIIAAAAVVLLVVIYIGASVYFKQRVVKDLNALAASAGFSEQVKYESLKVNPVTMNGTLKNVSVEQEGMKFSASNIDFNIVSNKSTTKDVNFVLNNQELKIGEVDVNKYKLVKGIPQSSDIYIKDFSIPVTSDELKASIGADNVTMDVEIETDADFKTNVFQYKKLNFLVKDLTDIKISLIFSGIDIKSYSEYENKDADALQADPVFINKIQKDIENIKINSFTFDFTDKGFINKVFFAPNNGMTTDELKNKMISDLMADNETAQSEFQKKLAQDMIMFVKENKTQFILTLNPAEPIGLQQLLMGGMMGMSFEDLAKSSGLKYEIK